MVIYTFVIKNVEKSQMNMTSVGLNCSNNNHELVRSFEIEE